MKGSGQMTKLMVKVFTLMQTVIITMVTGFIINNMALVQNLGMMESSMKVNILKTKRKDMVKLHLPMVATMKVNLNQMKFVVKGNNYSLMENIMKVNG